MTTHELADAIAAADHVPAARWLVAAAGTVPGTVVVGGRQLAVSPWIGTPPPAGQRVLLLLQDGASVVVAGPAAAARDTDLVAAVQELTARVAALEGGT